MVTVSQNFLEEGSRRTMVALSCAVWFVFGGFVLLVRVVSLARRKSVSYSLGRCFVSLVGQCRRSVFLLFSTPGGSVADELRKRRLVRAHSWLPYGVLVASIVVLTVFVRALSPGPRFNSSVQDAFMIAGCFIVLFLAACPSFVTLSTLSVWSSILAACITMWISPFAIEPAHAAESSLMPFAAMMVLCVFNLNVRLNVFWLLVLTASACSSVLGGTSDSLKDCDFETKRMRCFMHIAISGTMFTACVICLYRHIYLAAQYEMEARISRNELQAARSVLRGVCDAVVELDGDFRLQDGSPQLIDLLLLNSQRSLLGEDFRSFLASEQDRQKFTEQMGRSWNQGDDAGLSAAFHVSMKDSSSIPLVVEVFSVIFVNRGGQVAYFVGIREFTDISPILTMGSAAEVRHGNFHRGAGPESASLARARATPASNSIQDSSNVNSDALEFLNEAEAVGWIDIATAGYTVRHASPVFAQHLDVGSDFLDTLKPYPRSEFIIWAQRALLDLLDQGSDAAHRQYSEKLHMKCSARAATSGKRRSRRLVSAFVRLDLTPPPDGQRHGAAVMRIVLQDLRVDAARASSAVSKGTPRAAPRASLERAPPAARSCPEAEPAAAEAPQGCAEAAAGAGEARRGAGAGDAALPQRLGPESL
ncbi:unnamed protein product [Prorocentrum cordatum]|uniref:PAS domain-containing protein n=1 Tax=Prorocentrum cordatum TaxID=2364126 RepID=A0ABN9XDE7_9DINO|nr:unnamed protein product [Polarella glacialis]